MGEIKDWVVEGFCLNCQISIGVQHADRSTALYNLANLGCPNSIGHNFMTYRDEVGGRYKFTFTRATETNNVEV
jgi:hypothetical protein